ncbi:MAG: gamma-glutamyltransferase [Acetobacteraceae bacterium]|nr:gamma-glutamyltransferase [Acetobacteraceae bacterium]
MPRSLAARTAAVLLAVGLATTGCATLESVSDRLTGADRPKEGTAGFVRGFLGAAIADEPQAALAARAVLSAGGTAADAAVAAGFTLAVTLPSRASLGSGGACLAFAQASPLLGAEAVLFLPPPGGAGGDRPAAVPMLARGLFALHARYGRRPFESLIVPAEQLARFGASVSRTFASDLDVVASALSADPDTAAIFLPGGRRPVEGDTLLQPDLASTIGQLRVAGVGDLYQGGLARRFAEASLRAGGGITPAALRAALPSYQPAPKLALGGGDYAAFLPTDGGLAAGAAWRVLEADANAVPAAAARAAGVATAWRRGGYGGNPQAALDATDSPSGSLPPLPASTGFLTVDREGNAVACALTMNNLFGTGRVAPQTGVLLAASPNWMPPPLLSAAILYATHNRMAFKGAFTGTGQEGAPLAVAVALQQSVAARRALPNPVPEPGRANAMLCPGALPGSSGQCTWAADPRGHGLAAGSN